MSATTERPTLPRPIVRPNGKVWRPRKPLRFTEFSTNDYETGFVVFGTHDVEEALNLLGIYFSDYGLDPEQAEVTWWRSVPWSDGGFDYSFITDPERGTPCVVFEP